jgi:hypothetical protein
MIQILHKILDFDSGTLTIGVHQIYKNHVYSTHPNCLMRQYNPGLAALPSLF